MTSHATDRARQRGLRDETIDLVLDEADREVHAGRGCIARSLSKSGIERLAMQGVPRSRLERAHNVVLVLNPNGAVITVIGHPTWHARFHRGADRLTWHQQPATGRRLH